MFQTLTRLLRLISGFSPEAMEADRARKMYLSSYGATRHRFEGVDSRPLKIGDDQAMSLYRGGAWFETHLSRKRACVNVYDNVGPEELFIFRAYGDTTEQAEARARQLVSALDGARRL